MGGFLDFVLVCMTPTSSGQDGFGIELVWKEMIGGLSARPGRAFQASKVDHVGVSVERVEED